MEGGSQTFCHLFGGGGLGRGEGIGKISGETFGGGGVIFVDSNKNAPIPLHPNPHLILNDSSLTIVSRSPQAGSTKILVE